MSLVRVIITGGTGMVGEGVLLECLDNPAISEVLIINRRHYELQHPKLKELIVPDFFKLGDHIESIRGYDACFFCAGVSSVGMKEEKYTHLTYDTTLAFARVMAQLEPPMVFTYVSGSHTDSTEKGRMMWARVKGRTENELARLPFRAEYNFRPGAMLPYPGQKNWKAIYKAIVQVMRIFSASKVLTMSEVGKAMIHCVTRGYSKSILEIEDIRKQAND